MRLSRGALAPVLWIVALACGVVLPFVVSDYDLFDLTRVLTIAMAVAGLNLLIGHSGQISVGHGAIFGIGGYAALICVATFGLPWWVGVLTAAAACLAFGILLGLPALKMGGANLGLLTIAVAAVFPLLVTRLSDITGGTTGLYFGGSAISARWTGLSDPQVAYLVCLVILAVILLALRNLTTGRMGRALAAVRTSSLLAAANGVKVNRVKLVAFTVSSLVAGIGGALYALVLALAVPDNYAVTLSITLLTATVVGGARTWAGAIIGAAIVVYLPTLAEGFVGGQVAGNWSQLVYALGLILCLIFAPNGLAGVVGSIVGRVRRRFAGKPAAPSAAAPNADAVTGAFVTADAGSQPSPHTPREESQ